MTMQDAAVRLVNKYTGQDMSEAQLETMLEAPDGQAIYITLDKLTIIENRLGLTVKRLRDLADKIESNLTAKPGDMVYHLNSLGELQAENPDALIMTRDALINVLQVQVATYADNLGTE